MKYEYLSIQLPNKTLITVCFFSPAENRLVEAELHEIQKRSYTHLFRAIGSDYSLNNRIRRKKTMQGHPSAITTKRKHPSRPLMTGRSLPVVCIENESLIVSRNMDICIRRCLAGGDSLQNQNQNLFLWGVTFQEHRI